MNRILEICVDSLESALIAQQAGVDRIELCSCLEVGGLTPDPALFLLTKEKLKIPIHVLIRPRIGDFVYTEVEKTTIKKGIEFFKQHQADAIVVGALDTSCELDVDFLSRMQEAAYPLPVTFHRAFDLVPDPIKAFGQINTMGIERVLTSAQQPVVTDGIELLYDLLKQQSNTQVIAGGGVKSENVAKLLAIGITEIHASARKPNPSLMSSSRLSFSNLKPDVYRYADYDEIVNLRNQLNDNQSHAS